MLQLNDISKTFKGTFHPVLSHVNFFLAAGEFCVLIGANGSGKSTLFKLISKEYTPDVGTIQCQGKVSQVVQDVRQGVIPEMTLLENIALSLMRGKKPRFLFYHRYKQIITEKIQALNMGLEQYLHRPLKILSGGQRQIIATLMAINSGSQILLLDEHTSALDPKMQRVLMEYTASEIERLNLTTIMITHKMEDAIQYGDRLIMLNDGKIVLDIQGQEKKEMTSQALLALFHRYEDSTLLS